MQARCYYTSPGSGDECLDTPEVLREDIQGQEESDALQAQVLRKGEM